MAWRQGLTVGLVVLGGCLLGEVQAQTRVDGYFRRNGTYVQPHMRSAPDSNPYNNYSYPGNTNPYTGERATGRSETYLQNYGYGAPRAPRGGGSGLPDLPDLPDLPRLGR